MSAVNVDDITARVYALIEGAGSVELDPIVSYLEEESPTFQHTKTQEEWRACDNQAIQDWYIVEGKPRGEQQSEWDLFRTLGSVGGTDLLLNCDQY